MSDALDGSVGPPDRQTLQLLRRRLDSDPLVTAPRLEPDPREPVRLVVELDASQYPAPVTDARLDIRWFTSGDFSFHYVESADDERWECRWDRHPNPHGDRLHFHAPPDATDVESLSLSSTHSLDVSTTVIAALRQRVADTWRDAP